jgi:hypothetical protein
VKFKLVGTKSNRSAMGAVVRISNAGKPQTAVVLSQSGYYSHCDSRVHFGLGTAKSIDSVAVTWPTAVTEHFDPPAPNQVVTLTEGSGHVR